MLSGSEPKPSNDSEKSRTSWWSKCIPLSVRERRRSSSEVDSPAMTVADSPKKRKRTSSAKAGRKFPIQINRPKIVEMDVDEVNVRDFFDKKLGLPDASAVYSDKHSKLLNVEADHAWDGLARSSADEFELRAATIIHAMREFERRVIFGNLPSEAIPGPETLDMGGQFLTNKERIETKSKLFEVAQLVPKGALLHLHFNAELDPEQLLAQAREGEMKNHMHIRSIRPLITEEDLAETEMVFNVLDPSKINQDVDIFSKEYPGKATNWKEEKMQASIWMKWTTFQKEFEERFPNKVKQQGTVASTQKPVRLCCGNPPLIELNPAEAWLKSKMILSSEEAYGQTQTVNGVWARFNQATRCFKGLLNYRKVYEWYIGQAIDRLIGEGIMYAELRPMLLDKSIPTDDGRGKIDNVGQMQMIVDAVKAKQKQLDDDGELDKFPFGLKIVYCTPRSIPKKMMVEEMKQCIELKLKYPDLICGFDLVGAEDRPNNIGFYKEELYAFQETCKAKGLKIPFLFHAGESLLDTGGTGDPTKSNLYDAVIFEAKRIGHGFALMKHPQLIESFKPKPARRNVPAQEGICVELCPISNELLHLCRNIKEHPFPELLAAGIPCTVNSDNPSLFTCTMNHEFYQVMVGAPTISLHSWKQLAQWSLQYSCLKREEKDEGLNILANNWRSFCKLIVDVCDHPETGLMNVDKPDEVDEEKAKAFYAREAREHWGLPTYKS